MKNLLGLVITPKKDIIVFLEYSIITNLGAFWLGLNQG